MRTLMFGALLAFAIGAVQAQTAEIAATVTDDQGLPTAARGRRRRLASDRARVSSIRSTRNSRRK